ncbi:hypothetical protein, partial [Ralstonia solanacearum]|uniref:hypothetical protein n=1 Tax=Ralstonia solanacearum TaxID=305 RepID=UPI000AAB6608
TNRLASPHHAPPALPSSPLRNPQALAPNHNYKVSVEREETAGERWVRLIKDLTLFCAALLVFGMIVLLCYRALSSPQTSAEEKKWAMSGAHGGGRRHHRLPGPQVTRAVASLSLEG